MRIRSPLDSYRMLGSPSEADDAVEDAWLRLSRSDTSGIENLSGWPPTVVAFARSLAARVIFRRGTAVRVAGSGAPNLRRFTARNRRARMRSLPRHVESQDGLPSLDRSDRGLTWQGRSGWVGRPSATGFQRSTRPTR